MTAYRTRADAAELHPSGWERLSSGAWVTRHPLLDADAPGLLAHLTYRDALHVAELHGARLPTRAEVVEATEQAIRGGVVLRPVTLSFGPEMVSREHAETHDTRVAEQLAVVRWDGRSIVASAGKHWIAGAARGWARICGWWDGSRYIQAGTVDQHHDTHHDYATTTVLARDRPPVDDAIPDTDRAPAPTWSTGLDGTERLGLRCLAWLGYQAGLAPREVPGPRSDPRILAYSAMCRRGGTLLGVELPWDGGMPYPLWSGGTPLPLGRDEDAWCAALASATLLGALRPGDTPPHGLRVSVRELVEDARGKGTLRGLDYEPRPGDLGIDARAGGDPLRGGTGHVWRVDLVADGMAFGLGGNEANEIRVSWRPLVAPERRGWIAYP